MSNIETGRIIKQARKLKGLTQAQLATKLYVDKQAVSNWETGKNGVDEKLKDKLERILDIDLRQYRALSEVGKLEITPLKQITEMNDLLKQAKAIVDNVRLDDFCKASVSRMLEYVLYLVLGYEIYYVGIQEKRQNICDEDSGAYWEIIAEDLEGLLDNDLYRIPKAFIDRYLMEDGSFLNHKIHHMVFAIGSELFEDFDEEGWRNGYVQQIGRYGQDCGRNLKNILPALDNAVVTSFKCALCEMIELIRTML